VFCQSKDDEWCHPELARALQLGGTADLSLRSR
jgi:hypothetical protein